MPRLTRPEARQQIARLLVLNAAALLLLVPFLWLISTALKGPGETVTAEIRWIPQRIHLAENFAEVFRAAPFLRYLGNTVVVVFAILGLQLSFVIPAAYALARLTFAGQEVVLPLFIVQIMLPIEAILLPNYFLIKAMGLLDTRTALVLPFVASGFGVFQFRQVFKQIPQSLEDAARIDGAGHLGFIWHVLLPLSRPTLVTFSMLSIAAHWDDFYWPLIVTESDRVRTLAIGLGLFVKQESGAEWSLLMAATLFVCAPIILLFLVAQRSFVRSFLTSGIKG